MAETLELCGFANGVFYQGDSSDHTVSPVKTTIYSLFTVHSLSIHRIFFNHPFPLSPISE
jgi:hypothetical protein